MSNFLCKTLTLIFLRKNSILVFSKDILMIRMKIHTIYGKGKTFIYVLSNIDFEYIVYSTRFWVLGKMGIE